MTAEHALVVMTTVPEPETGKAIATALLEARIAACIQLMPAGVSLYEWQGNIEESTEHLLFIKCQKQHYAAIEAQIVALHPYEVPEIIALPVEQGLPAYLNWIDEVTS
ncbi:MAG: divalent-cation tolerance protein CutA [Idiomarina sp.]|nr:divalent-cation tolerance protein CutA [Idiomarina sp.]